MNIIYDSLLQGFQLGACITGVILALISLFPIFKDTSLKDFSNIYLTISLLSVLFMVSFNYFILSRLRRNEAERLEP